jgi:hypothetical protein
MGEPMGGWMPLFRNSKRTRTREITTLRSKSNSTYSALLKFKDFSDLLVFKSAFHSSGSGTYVDITRTLAPYTKVGAPYAGTVYVVAGTAGRNGTGMLGHPAMYWSQNSILGSMAAPVSFAGNLSVKNLRPSGFSGSESA